jgi:hypothetical protein
MGYLHIDNLYKNQDILLFKECYALEKIDGTSAHIHYNGELDKLIFFSGGAKHEVFIKLFDEEFLKNKIKELAFCNITIYGEAYGGKIQGMSNTYGKDLKFIVFDISLGEYTWLNVPDAANIAKQLNLEFVPYKILSTDIDTLTKERELPSIQSKLNGIIEDRRKEGLVLRPLIELKKNNGERIIVKFKNEDFRETKTKRKILDIDKLKILEDANAIANEWVTLTRLNHVLDKTGITDICNAKDLIFAMIEDIKREGDKEIIWSKDVEKTIGKKTINLFKETLKNNLFK